jgi:putative endonuclease
VAQTSDVEKTSEVEELYNFTSFKRYLFQYLIVMAEHNELGKKGETAAVEFLQQNGHQLILQNYKHGKAEIDIISKEDNIIVFTEVKTRSTDYFGFPEEAVDKKKRKKIQRAAEEYLFQNKIDGPVRFDIVSITNQKGKMKIYHIKDAFFNEEDDGVYDQDSY